MSRFEAGLSDRISVLSESPARALLELRLAAYLARKGDKQAARQMVSRIRNIYESLGNAQLMAHVNFAEALCEFFEIGTQPALVKLQRSQALSIGCPFEDDLPVLSAAWSASLHRILGDWKGFKDSTDLALDGRHRISSEALCRLRLVVADSLQEVQDYDRAEVWYRATRHESLALGDETVLGALLYNKSAIRVFNVRVDEVFGKKSDLDRCSLALEAASAENLAQYTHDVSMPWVFDMLAGQLMLLQGNFSEALTRLDSSNAQDLGRRWPGVDLVRRSDLLRAKSALGSLTREQVLNEVRELKAPCERETNFGDCAVSAYSLAKAVDGIDQDKFGELRYIADRAANMFQEQRLKEMMAVNILVKRLTSLQGELI